MSDERKDQRPLDSDFPGEEQLSRLYRDGSEDLPPANLDAVILDAARQAVHARPRRVYFFPSRKWVVPLSLAAALWLTFEVVRMQRTEITRPYVDSRSSSAPQFESRAAKPHEADEVIDTPPPASVQPLEEKMLTQRQPTEPQAKQILRARDRTQDAREARTSRGLAPMPSAPHMRAVQPLTQTPRDKREVREEEADMATDAARLQAETASQQPAQAASDEQEKSEGELAAPTSPPVFLSDAPPAAEQVVTEARKEQALSLKEWLAKIKELRRSGKVAEAEASLKAFKERYPGYPAEKFLQEQPEALHTP